MVDDDDDDDDNDDVAEDCASIDWQWRASARGTDVC